MPKGLARIWSFLASEGPLNGIGVGDSIFLFLDRITRGEWDGLLKQELIEAFSPLLDWHPETWSAIFPDEPRDGTRISHFTEAELSFRSGDQIDFLRVSIDSSPNRSAILRDLADDATSLLKRAMELLRLVEKADDQSDGSYSDQPSISPHSQNSGLRNWTVLIELVRDAWLELLPVSGTDKRADGYKNGYSQKEWDRPFLADPWLT
jgi:hypothetical protein